MPKQKLALANIGELSGGAFGAVVDKALMNAVNDACDRPNIKKARKVTIELEVKPNYDENSRQARSFQVSGKCKVSGPAQQTSEETFPLWVDTATGEMNAVFPDSFQETMFDQSDKGNN